MRTSWQLIFAVWRISSNWGCLLVRQTMLTLIMYILLLTTHKELCYLQGLCMVCELVNGHSVSLLHQVKNGMWRLNWHEIKTVFVIHYQRLWIYCPGHAGVRGNDWADRLADIATITSGLCLEKSELLRSAGDTAYAVCMDTKLRPLGH